MCCTLRHTQTNGKNPQGAVTDMGDTILINRGFTFDHGHCMRYDLFQVKWPKKLGIGLESFIAGPGAFNDKWLP